MGIDIPSILLVEDSDPDAEMTLDALEAGGVANPVVRMSDGDSALRYLMKAQAGALPRLVLLDLSLGALDGLDVLRTIRSVRRLENLPVIVLTGSDDSSDRAVAKELAALAFVTKPLDSIKFFNAIRSLGERWGILEADVPAAPP
jgi:two-component system response regulator